MSAIAGLNQDAAELQQRIERFQAVRDGILTQVRQVIVGQDDVLDQILIALFVGGHCLITGMPGTAKTLMVRTIAQTLGLTFRRIQFTPDLMPSDITGHGHHRRGHHHGPSQVDLRRGAALRQCGAGGRDQPHSAEDAGGDAGGDAGAVLHGARAYLQIAGAVLCAGHAEPD